MRRTVLAAILMAIVATAFGQSASQPTLTAKERWESIVKYFGPPQEYDARMGPYRTLMKFDDGRDVRKPADWEKRRTEIRAYWDKKLGAWPKLLDKPAVEFVSNEHVENFTRHKIRIQLAQTITRDAYLLVPDGEGIFPAVISVFYDAETSAGLSTKPTMVAFGYDLAKRGFVTLCLGSVDADVRKPEDHPVQPLMYLAYVAANAHTALSQMKQVDAAKIGIIGHSFGGKWAMFASCLHDKFAAAVWCDPGIVWNESDPNANYWEPWYLGADKSVKRKPGVPTKDNPRTGPYKEIVEEGHDLHELHALMAPRPFLVSGGDQDRAEHWMALNHTIALNKFLGAQNRVAMTLRQGHTPTEESKQQMYSFLEHFLRD